MGKDHVVVSQPPRVVSNNKPIDGERAGCSSGDERTGEDIVLRQLKLIIQHIFVDTGIVGSCSVS